MTVATPDSYTEHDTNAVNQRSAGTNGDQAVHIGTAMPQRLKSPAKVTAIQVNHRQGQQQLQQRRRHEVIMIPMWQRQSCHVAHGKIHEHS